MSPNSRLKNSGFQRVNALQDRSASVTTTGLLAKRYSFANSEYVRFARRSMASILSFIGHSSRTHHTAMSKRICDRLDHTKRRHVGGDRKGGRPEVQFWMLPSPEECGSGYL